MRHARITSVDKVVAALMEKELTGRDLGGWQLAECIGYGKSALVFRALKGTQSGAVKVFDRELVEKFGKDAQRERVLREKSLVGKHHPNLIEILDAGEDVDRDLFFVVMALFPGKNLAEALAAVPHDRVHALIAQIAAAARVLLEEQQLAHRDIKPENVGVSEDYSTAMLLDLGVLRPVGFSSITDQSGQRTFIGTLQYSPPELLQREEQDSIDGWRAVTFYQLGGVLHDLLTRAPLFSDDLTPYGRLVEAVSHTIVTIQAPGAAPELRMLAQDCLVKDPLLRLQLVTWERFEQRPTATGDMDAVRGRIAQRQRSTALAAAATTPTIAPSILERQAVDAFRDDVVRMLRDACKQSELPSFTVHTDDSTVVRVRLVFGPSRAHAVTGATFAVYIEGTVVDGPGRIVLVRGAAAVCQQAAALPVTALEERLVQLFQGVRADDVLIRRLTDALLSALDLAQDLCAQGRVNTAADWLSIGGGA